jgi:hypothetical protein
VTTQAVGWVSVFLDVPGDQLDACADFWAAATGSRRGDPEGDHGEFLPLVPDRGDPCLWLQRTSDGPVGCHPDLYVDDVDAAATQVVDLGAAVTRAGTGLVTLTSPGGLPFCLVTHRDQVERPEPVGPSGARSVVDQVCLDIPADRFEAEAGFWSAWTGWPRVDRRAGSEFERLVRPGGIPYAFLLQRLDDDQPAVTAHLDLATEDRDATTRRHVALGAEPVRRTDEWTVMRDPAGVTYCNTVRRPGAV